MVHLAYFAAAIAAAAVTGFVAYAVGCDRSDDEAQRWKRKASRTVRRLRGVTDE